MDLLPTGVVVRVMQSAAREKDIIARVRAAVRPQSMNNQDSSLTESASGREEYVLVVPMDRTLPKIRICTRQKAFLAGKKVVVNIDNWNRDSMYPNGHITRYVSGGSDFESEITALLMEHSISIRPFSVAALSLLPPVDMPLDGRRVVYDSQWAINEAELRSRRDYRKTRQVFRYG
jgi:exoribonuclease R